MLTESDGRSAGRIIQLIRLASLSHHPERTRRSRVVLLRERQEDTMRTRIEYGRLALFSTIPANEMLFGDNKRTAASLLQPGEQRPDRVDPAETDELERRRLLE
jgi:hypothetical protein